MSKITVEIDEKYREQLDLLKQVVPSQDGGEIKNDSEMVGALIESFVGFIQEQAQAHADNQGGCCGGGSCSH